MAFHFDAMNERSAYIEIQQLSLQQKKIPSTLADRSSLYHITSVRLIMQL